MRYISYCFSTLLLLFILSSCGSESAPVYNLTATPTPGEAGSVTPSSGEFDEGETIDIAATPNDDWIFDGWEGDASGSENPTTVTMNADKDIAAIFVLREYPLTIETEGEGTVSEQMVQEKTTDYEAGTVVELTAEPADGWEFIEWQGDLEGIENPKQITVDNDKNVTAVFEIIEYPLMVNIEGDGTVAENVVQGKTTDYPHGTTVELTANPADGWYFKEWQGDLTSNQNPQQITINQEVNVTAVFYPNSITAFGGSGEDFGNEVIEASDGGYVIVGSTTSYDQTFEDLKIGNQDIFVIKLDELGQLVWVRTYGGSGTDEATSIVQSFDGGYVLTGSTTSNSGSFSENAGSYDIFALKIDSNGNEEWARTIGGDRRDMAYSITKGSNTYAITGYTISETGDFSDPKIGDIFVLNLDANGNKNWLKTYGGTGIGIETATDIVSSSSGGYLLTGYTSSNDNTFLNLNPYDNRSAFVIKINDDGNEEWVKVIGGNSSEVANSITENPNGGYAITGSTSSNDGDFQDLFVGGEYIFVTEIDTDGNKKWIKSFGGWDADRPMSITTAQGGGYVFTGGTRSDSKTFDGMNQGFDDIFLIKVDENGNKEWVNTYGSTWVENGQSVISKSNGDFAITGLARGDDGDFEGMKRGNRYIYLLRVNENGEMK